MRGTRRVSERLASWSEARGEALDAWKRTLTEMRSGTVDFATLTVGVDGVRSLTTG